MGGTGREVVNSKEKRKEIETLVREQLARGRSGTEGSELLVLVPRVKRPEEMGRLRPWEEQPTGRGSEGGCAAVAWRWLVHGKFSKWRFRSGREACEGGGRV